MELFNEILKSINIIKNQVKVLANTGNVNVFEHEACLAGLPPMQVQARDEMRAQAQNNS